MLLLRKLYEAAKRSKASKKVTQRNSHAKRERIFHQTYGKAQFTMIILLSQKIYIKLYVIDDMGALSEYLMALIIKIHLHWQLYGNASIYSLRKG